MTGVPVCEVPACELPAPGMVQLCERHAGEYDQTGLHPAVLIADELAARTLYAREQWQAAVDAAGGDARVRALIIAAGQPLDTYTPELIAVAHTACRVLDLDPSGVSRPSS